MAMFTVTMVNGPGWDGSRQRRAQRGWSDHAAFMEQLVDDGFVILGGPIDDGARVLLAVEATDERAVKARLAQDPWLPMGVIQIAAIAPWTIWLDGRSAHPDFE